MANSYTDKYKKRQPAAGDLNWDDEMNQNQTIDDVLGTARDQNNRTIWGLAATDGGGLTVSYAAGRAEVDGSVFEIAASSKTAVDDASDRSVNWLYVDSSGVVQISQSAPTGNYAPIAMVDVSSGAIDRIGDFRQQPSGLLADETIAEINKIIATTGSVVGVAIIDTTEWFDVNPNDLPALMFAYADNVGVKFHDATDVQLPAISDLEITLSNISSMPDLITGRLLPIGSSAGVNVYDVGNNSELFITYSTTTTPALPNNLVNHVATTVLLNAPIDQATGLPVPTLAVATDGSIRVIKDDGVAVSYRDVSGDDTNDVLMTSYGSLIYTNETQTNLDVFRDFKLDTVTQETPDVSYDTVSIPALLANPDTISRGLIEGLEGTIIIGAVPGVTLLKEDPAAPTNSMVNYITKDYQSGWMQGDVELCLSGENLTDKSVTGTTVTDNGTATFTDASTNTELQKTTASGGTITAPVTTGGECYGWEFVASIWEFRETISDWVGVSEAAGTLTIADGTVFTKLKYVNGAGPSAEQLIFIEETEKHLFEDDAFETFGGTSNTVVTNTYDGINNLLYIGTGDGVSVFSGLQRVDYIDTTGIPTSDIVKALAASGGAYVIGNAAEAVGYIPAANLREEIVRQETAGEVLVIHWDVGDTSETDFVMPAGYKPKFVYEAGLIVKEGSGEDYTVAFDGFLYTVVFGAAPAAVNLGFMIVRA